MNDTSMRYEIIHEMVTREDSVLEIKSLCQIANVSRSGYYAWVKAEDKRKIKEEQDKKDFNLVLEAYNFRGYYKGARSIHMRLLHVNVVMNVKKIRRLMDKYNLHCPIRKHNPYRQMARAIKTNSVAANLLNREFEKHGPRTVLLTDITYIRLNYSFVYLSVIIDAYTKQVLSYVLSDSLEVDFVLETVNKLIEKHGHELKTNSLIHSDQGCHYTSISFRNLISDYELRQSMSRKGNCWDNAPQESFFGHMKDEINHQVKSWETINDVKATIDDWMDYYNNDRYQWDLAKLSPNEFYQYYLTNNYPIKQMPS